MSGPKHTGPLGREERALADALGSTLHAGPAPGIDAAILASARAEAARRKAGPDDVAARQSTPPAPMPARSGPGGPGARPHRRRGPAWLRGGALAASLVIASGVAWQLKPRYEGPELSGNAAEHRGSAPQAAAREVAPPSARGTAPAPARTPVSTPPTAAGFEPGGNQVRRSAARETRAIEAPGSTAEPVRKHSRAAPPTMTEPEPAPEPPALTPPPPAPAPAPAPPAPSAPPAGSTPTLSAPLPAAPARPRPEADATRSRALHAEAEAEAAGGVLDTGDAPAWLDQPLDDTPPASVDSPQVREAWLARIHELIAAGHRDQARASYGEFRRRHPDAPVPDDLRTLLDGE